MCSPFLARNFLACASVPAHHDHLDPLPSLGAALDTVNTSRVADYLCSQRGTQYICVSHRPQLYERGSCLVGVYSCQRGCSSAVTLHL